MVILTEEAYACRSGILRIAIISAVVPSVRTNAGVLGIKPAHRVDHPGIVLLVAHEVTTSGETLPAWVAVTGADPTSPGMNALNCAPLGRGRGEQRIQGAAF